MVIYDTMHYINLMRQGLTSKEQFVSKDPEYSEEYKKGYLDAIKMTGNLSMQIQTLMQLGVTDLYDDTRINPNNITPVVSGIYREIY